ncbi:polyprenyl synthetase family protein [bacterium]|nr:polyprenyl synthetase family protein [bacterium]
MKPEVAELDAWRTRFEAALSAALPPAGGPLSPLPEAMRHAALAGGKRLRPLLVLASCEAAGGAWDDAISAALALEMVHTYSLVHDDLPAMDDDDLRRGRPTVHVAFNEATAILAGDALLTLAFETLTRAEIPAERVVAEVRCLAGAAGALGMVGGQQLDLSAEGKPATEQLVTDIDRLKTGALLSAAFELGALAAGAPPSFVATLRRIGDDVGLAFQIQDDLLDETATAEQLGKTPGKDKEEGKATWPAAVGAAEARRRADALLSRSLAALAALGPAAARLTALVERTAGRAS